MRLQKVPGKRNAEAAPGLAAIEKAGKRAFRGSLLEDELHLVQEFCGEQKPRHRHWEKGEMGKLFDALFSAADGAISAYAGLLAIPFYICKKIDAYYKSESLAGTIATVLGSIAATGLFIFAARKTIDAFTKPPPGNENSK